MFGKYVLITKKTKFCESLTSTSSVSLTEWSSILALPAFFDEDGYSGTSLVGSGLMEVRIVLQRYVVAPVLLNAYTSSLRDRSQFIFRGLSVDSERMFLLERLSKLLFLIAILSYSSLPVVLQPRFRVSELLGLRHGCEFVGSGRYENVFNSKKGEKEFFQ